MADIKNTGKVTISSAYANTMMFLTLAVSFDNSNYRIAGSTVIGIDGNIFQSGNGNLEFSELPLVRGGQLLSGTSFQIRSDISKFLVNEVVADPPIVSYSLTLEAGDTLIWKNKFQDEAKSSFSHFITTIEIQ